MHPRGRCVREPVGLETGRHDRIQVDRYEAACRVTEQRHVAGSTGGTSIPRTRTNPPALPRPRIPRASSKLRAPPSSRAVPTNSIREARGRKRAAYLARPRMRSSRAKYSVSACSTRYCGLRPWTATSAVNRSSCSTSTRTVRGTRTGPRGRPSRRPVPEELGESEITVSVPAGLEDSVHLVMGVGLALCPFCLLAAVVPARGNERADVGYQPWTRPVKINPTCEPPS